MPVPSCRFVFDIFQDSGSDKPRQLSIRQNAIDNFRRQATTLMIALEYGPSGTSAEPKRSGLRIECIEALGDESLGDFANLDRLTRLHLSHRMRTMELGRMGTLFRHQIKL